MRSIPEKESFTVEFLSDREKLSDSKLLDEVVGLANTFGGNIYVGIEDDGEITGVHKEHNDSTVIKSLIENKTEPTICVQTQIVEVENTKGTLPVLAITVPLARAGVVSVDGRIMGRCLKLDGSPETVQLSPEQISIRLGELKTLDYSEKLLADASDEDSDALEISRLKDFVANNPESDAINDLYLMQIRYALKHQQELDSKR